MDKEVLQSYLKAGHVAASALQFGARQIKPGVRMVDGLDAVEAKIKAMGADMAFPAQSSVNSVAAHFCPVHDDPLTYKEGDLVKIDVGVHVDGYIADTAVSVNLGGWDDLVKASQEARDAALRIVAPGVSTAELGRAIQEAITGYGFAPVHNLSGHGISRWVIHDKPSVPNYDTGKGVVLQEDQVIAIEPFATMGTGAIMEGGNPTVFAVTANRPVRSAYAREVLRALEAYNGLPFTTRWLTRQFGDGKARLAIRELLAAGVLHAYPPLPDKDGKLVSQSEKACIVGKKTIVYTEVQEDQ